MSLVTGEKHHPNFTARLAAVPAFPTVVTRLLSLLGDNSINMSGISACIATDPILAGRVLRRANSADMLSESKDVLQAILALGIERTREITMATATAAYLGGAMQAELLRPCWHHTVACALISSEIAKLAGVPQGEPYTAGLLHDIGRLGLLTAWSGEYEDLLKQAAEEGADLRELERGRFGVDHTEAGRWLAQRWNLPETMALVIANHHEAPKYPLSTLSIVQTACRLADLLGFAVCPAPQVDFNEATTTLPEPVRRKLWDRIPAIQESVREQIEFFEKEDPVEVEAPLEVNLDEEDAEVEEMVLELPLAFARKAGVSKKNSRGAWVLLAVTAAVVLLAILWVAR